MMEGQVAPGTFYEIVANDGEAANAQACSNQYKHHVSDVDLPQ